MGRRELEEELAAARRLLEEELAAARRLLEEELAAARLSRLAAARRLLAHASPCAFPHVCARCSPLPTTGAILEVKKT